MTNENIFDITEDFIFVWLDRNIEANKDNRDVKALIRRLVRGHLLTFTDPNRCIDCIYTELKRKQIYFIVSNEFGRNSVAVIHSWSQVHTIYVYCGSPELAKQWKKPYDKVTAIFTEKQDLLKKICQDVKGYYKDHQVPMSVFHLEEQENSLQSLTKESVNFMWYKLMLDVLLDMAKYGDSKAEIIAECYAKYYENEIEKTKIDKFKRSYDATNAFWWYTNDSCIFRLLNTALRTQNIEIIFKFRLFIQDLHNQINGLYQQYLSKLSSNANHQLIVYRGQFLGMDEIDLLKRSEKQLISMNSFLSATTKREIAQLFINTSDQSNQSSSSSLQSVLFIIEVRGVTNETIPFAFIQEYSCCRDEEEVLFSIGAVFNVQSVKREGQIWCVHLQLSKQQNILCENLFRRMREQIGSQAGPLSLGWFLYRVTEFNKAERYVEFIRKTFPPNDKVIGDAYNLLGLICKDTKRLKDSVEYYKKALHIYSQVNLGNSSRTISTHNNLGLAYLALHDIQGANDQCQQAKNKLRSASFGHDLLLTATTDNLIAKIETTYGNYQDALLLFESVLMRKHKIFTPDHPSIGSTLNNIGITYEKAGDNKMALDYFNRALEIYKKSMPSDHIDYAECLENMSRIHQKNQHYTLASQQHQLAWNIQKNVTRNYPTEPVTTTRL